MDWDRAAELYWQALDQPAPERERYLAGCCTNDPEMLAELLAMLAARQGATEMLGGAVAEAATGAAQPCWQGQRLGPYRILQPLGAGGMGSVYLAGRDDDQYHKQVAIKLVRGVLPGTGLAGRFRRERQILAGLEHPHIARLLDGGAAADGTPYLVMEYIEGQPLVDYANLSGLDLAGRLALFGKVCGAVEYAHQRLIVHRDLKPDNILVGADGEPKLLDFGIAKLLEAEPGGEARAETTALNPFTPQYASPEQMRGEPVTTSTDVYALGLLLYELVCGRPAHIFAGPSQLEMAQVVCERDPLGPPEAARAAGVPWASRVAGDLETVILRALEQDPRRRYGSAAQLREDLERFLAERPVAARPATPGYRALKFVRRNRLAVAAAALLALSLLAGSAATAWQARVARAERAVAERRFQEVRALANSFLFEFHDAIAKLPGATPARQLVVREALKYLERLSRESAGDAALEHELAEAYQRISEIQYRPGFSHLGDREGALASARAALEIRTRLAAAAPGPENALALAAAEQRWGDIVPFMGRPAEALAAYEKAEALVRELPGLPARRTLALLNSRLGDMNQGRGKPEEAAGWYRKSQATLDELLRANPADTTLRRMLGVSFIKLGDVAGNPNLPNLGDPKGALAHYRRARELAGQVAAAEPANPQYVHDLAVADDRTGDMLHLAGDYPAAIAHHRAATAALRRQSEQDPADMGARRDLAVTLGKVAQDLADSRNYSAALATFGEVLRQMTELSQNDPQTLLYVSDRAEAFDRIAATSLRAGDTAAALEAGARATWLREQVLEKNPVERQTALAHAALLKLLGEHAAPADACRYRLRSLHWYKRLAAEGALNGPQQALPGQLLSLTRGCAGQNPSP